LLKYLGLERRKAGDPDPDTSANAIFEDVRWAIDPSAPTTIPATGAVRPLRKMPGQIPTLDHPERIRERIASSGGESDAGHELAARPDLRHFVASLFGWLDPRSSPFAAGARFVEVAELSFRRQRDFLAGLELSTVKLGLAAAERMERTARDRGRRFGVF